MVVRRDNRYNRRSHVGAIVHVVWGQMCLIYLIVLNSWLFFPFLKKLKLKQFWIILYLLLAIVVNTTRCVVWKSNLFCFIVLSRWRLLRFQFVFLLFSLSRNIIRFMHVTSKTRSVYCRSSMMCMCIKFLFQFGLYFVMFFFFKRPLWLFLDSNEWEQIQINKLCF